MCNFCPRRFKTSRGLKIHMVTCNCQHDLSDETFEINDINAVFGTQEQRWFLCWKDHPDKCSWESDRSLCHLHKQGYGATIHHFWNKSSLNPATDFIADPDDIWRCYCCGKGYKTEGGLYIQTHKKDASTSAMTRLFCR